jgi:hypothetical protein
MRTRKILRRARDTVTGEVAVKISLQPEDVARKERNRRAALPTARAIRLILDGMVTKAIRARLRTGNLLTGQRRVTFGLRLRTKVVAIKPNPPLPEQPTRPASLDALQERLLAVVEGMQGTLQRTDRLIARIDQAVVPELAPTLRDARQTLERTPQAILT